MSVIEFKRKESDEPHLSGNAQCFGCGHKWVCVAPVGVTSFECPSCHTLKGTFRNICMPEKDKEIWQCDCGNDLFIITKVDGAMCVNCGTYQRWGK